MWRIPGLLSRALTRLHAANVQGCVHGEAEALNPSSLIPLGQNAGGRSYSSQSAGEHGGQNGQRQKKKGNFQFCTGQLPQCSMLDAFGVGAAAVFFLHLARQISFHCSTSSSREERSPRRTYLEEILTTLSPYNNLSVKSHIVPKTVPPRTWNELRLQSEANQQDADSSIQGASTASSSGRAHHVTEQGDSQSDDFLGLSSSCELDTREAETSAPEPLEPKEEIGDSLQGAASRLLDVTESSVPTALNIFGIISARDGRDYKTAFKFFLESAEAGYGKAQYNAAVCYEKGKGVGKDMAKAAALYLSAARGGHQQAKYRYARYLLNAKPEDARPAVTMLEEAAQAGVKEAQAYLGVFYSKESHSDPQKAARYFWMAAENGDLQSRFHLGVCYERGFGVPASRQEALRHFERAAKSGHEASREKLVELRPPLTTGLSAPLASLRSTTSSPCLPVLERVKVRIENSSHLSAESVGNPGLPHTWSIGNLGLPHSLSTGNLGLLNSLSHGDPGLPHSLSSRDPGLPHSLSSRDPGLPHSLSSGDLLISPAESSGFLLPPIHVTSLAPPMTSLRAIGVG